jgi:hypothetical protein
MLIAFLSKNIGYSCGNTSHVDGSIHVYQHVEASVCDYVIKDDNSGFQTCCPVPIPILDTRTCLQ